MIDLKTIEDIREFIGEKLGVPKESVFVTNEIEIPDTSYYQGCSTLTVRVAKYFNIPEFQDDIRR